MYFLTFLLAFDRLKIDCIRVLTHRDDIEQKKPSELKIGFVVYSVARVSLYTCVHKSTYYCSSRARDSFCIIIIIVTAADSSCCHRQRRPQRRHRHHHHSSAPCNALPI